MRSPGMRRFEPSVSVLQTVFHEFISSTPIRCGRHVQRFFSDVRLVKLMEWPVLFLGGSPARVRLRLPASLWSRHVALRTANESVRFVCEHTTCTHARTHTSRTHSRHARTPRGRLALGPNRSVQRLNQRRRSALDGHGGVVIAVADPCAVQSDEPRGHRRRHALPNRRRHARSHRRAHQGKPRCRCAPVPTQMCPFPVQMSSSPSADPLAR
jgi:hypothetical protein